MKRALRTTILGLTLLIAAGCGSDDTTAGQTSGTQQGEIQGKPTLICGTGEDTKPTPTGIAQLDQPSGGITGAGSSFVAPLMTAWAGQFEQELGAEVRYASVGSGAGVARISEGRVDFGATDSPMTDEELAAADGTILHVPLVFGAVVPAYHVPGQKSGLHFTADVLGKIFTGRITRWDDPELVALNPEAKLPSTPIAVVHRSDSSGTTAIFTGYLTKTSPSWVEALPADKRSGREVPWPVGNAGKGNEGVAAVVNETEGAIGYVELTYALSTGLEVGFVQNKSGNFIQPCAETVTAAARDIAISPDLRLDLTDTPGVHAYPISGAVWALVYERQQDATRANTLVNFLAWALDVGQTKARAHNYAPLSPEVRALALDQVKKITLDGQPIAR
ncbi:MAG: phosphate ABC transporter substrate-binding protein PstS [Actinomycetota bacterium]|jgi:phosphate transport system substrate-binding protein